VLPTRDRLSVPLTRRTLIAAGAAAAATLITCPTPAQAQPALEPPPIHPRDDWAQGLQPVGPLSVEAPEDVRFLLIHHSATPNGDLAEQIPARIRGFFNYHTNEKGWPDVAYNFFVDPYGGLWEGRQGSLDAPVTSLPNRQPPRPWTQPPDCWPGWRLSTASTSRKGALPISSRGVRLFGLLASKS